MKWLIRCDHRPLEVFEGDALALRAKLERIAEDGARAFAVWRLQDQVLYKVKTRFELQVTE